MKTCSRCKELKGKTKFYFSNHQTGKLYSYCKLCCRIKAKERYDSDSDSAKAYGKEWSKNNRQRRRIHQIKHKYGLSEEDYEKIPKICTIYRATEKLRIDHSHQSGRVRGMLCNHCNTGLGLFRDDPTLLYRAADYVLGALPEINSTQGMN